MDLGECVGDPIAYMAIRISYNMPKENSAAHYKRQLAEKERQLAEKERQLAEKERQLAEKDLQLDENARTIRALSTSGESPADDRALLRGVVDNLHVKNDALIKRIDEMERNHEAEMAEMRAERARELNCSRPDGSKGGSKGGSGKGGSGKGGAGGAALLNSPATPSPMNPVKYAQEKACLKAKAEECERVNGGF